MNKSICKDCKHGKFCYMRVENGGRGCKWFEREFTNNDLKFFIESCLTNTKNLSEALEKSGDIPTKVWVDFTHRYIFEMARNFGYKA